MKPPSERALATLQRYREATSLGAQEQARLGALLHERVTRGDLPRFDVQPPAPRVAASSLAQRLLAVGAAKLAAVVVVVGAIGGYAWHAASTNAPKPVRLAPLPAVRPAVREAPEPQPAVPPAATEPRAMASSAPTKPAASGGFVKAPASASAATIDGEVQLMTEAQSALRAGDGKRALALLGEHASRFPSGKLTTLRQVTHMLALCQTGRVALAQSEAAAFLAKNPGSPFSERVSHICSK